MQYDDNAEKYGYEGEMTPLKCDKLNAYKADVTIPVYGTIADAKVYLKKEADEAIAELKAILRDHCMNCPVKEQEDDVVAELKAENAELKKKLMPCLNGDCILTCEVVEKYGKENAELKKKLEDVQASMYCDVVDANMENRRLKRALWLARAERAKAMYTYWHIKCIEGHLLYEHKWIVVDRKCRAKAERYGEGE